MPSPVQANLTKLAKSNAKIAKAERMVNKVIRNMSSPRRRTRKIV